MIIIYSVYLDKFKETSLDGKIKLVTTKFIKKNRVSVKFVEKCLSQEHCFNLGIRPYSKQIYDMNSILLFKNNIF